MSGRATPRRITRVLRDTGYRPATPISEGFEVDWRWDRRAVVVTHDLPIFWSGVDPEAAQAAWIGHYREALAGWHVSQAGPWRLIVTEGERP